MRYASSCDDASTTDVEKTKIRDRDAGEKVSSLPGWRRTNTGRTQAKTGGELKISLARTSITGLLSKPNKRRPPGKSDFNLCRQGKNRKSAEGLHSAKIRLRRPYPGRATRKKEGCRSKSEWTHRHRDSTSLLGFEYSFAVHLGHKGANARLPSRRWS
jgi:hypothetical protein